MRNSQDEPFLSATRGVTLCCSFSQIPAPQASLLRFPPRVLSIALWINFYPGKREGVTFIVHKWITLDSIADPSLPSQRRGSWGKWRAWATSELHSFAFPPSLWMGKWEGAEIRPKKSTRQTYKYTVITKEDIKMGLRKLITLFEC